MGINIRSLKNLLAYMVVKRENDRICTLGGLPLKGNHKSFFFGKIIIEKIERRLATWSSRYTSKGGRLTLIQVTLSNLPNYYMSLFEMPQKVAANIGRLFRNYLWKDSCTPCSLEYYKPPNRKGRSRSSLDKEEEHSSPRQMDMEISS